MNEEFEGVSTDLNTERGSEEVENTNPVEENPKGKEKIRKGLAIALYVFIGIIVGTSITMAICKSYVDTQMAKILQNPDGKISYLEYLIDTYFYNDVEQETLQNGAYHGIFDSLEDPYSQYFTPEEYEEYSSVVNGNFGGIGAGLQKDADTGEVVVTKVYADSPAEKGGVKEGDIIVSADGHKGVNYSLEDYVSKYLRGDEGTEVTIVIDREGEEIEITLVRDIIEVETVSYKMLDNNIGYIQISQFTGSTDKEFEKAFEDLQAQGMTSVIYDLRNNGGGIVDTATNILDYLLPKGTVMYTMDKAGNRRDYNSDASHKEIPTVVLVNGNTASSAEIFTGAIRDFKYGTIIGTQTYGKGIVQTSFKLQDGSAIKLTTNKYYTPSGECIHGQGITPDVVIEYEFLGGEDDEYAVEFDNQLQKALEVLRQ
ncbi:carboxyl-terminal processing protease [Pseudobutyrivibrio sp. AR14]|uniref:S41 family peptidase n=1 Tax=Pseudobutyrivibrio sp. AR14 TaxID=1520804 RepID=UPI00087E454C|nr:S41 family peptidase [Pseudobutyrivibrio sp. AR14]SCY19447.1 carboxyl-terminal processing protease [Pseudobutyrivibrio sp. AR14]